MTLPDLEGLTGVTIRLVRWMAGFTADASDIPARG